jgi:hypothetical protein
MTHRFQATLLAIAIATLGLSSAQAATMAKADYTAEKSRISADYKTDKAACDAMKANAKDICVEEAKAKEKVALADLEFRYTGKAADGTKLQMVRADTAYAVAKEKCDDLKGNDKDVCVKEAKAVQAKATADAKMVKKVSEARTDAAQTKVDADYKVAAEKCDAMSGDAKTACMNAAKAKFGKS